MALLDKFSASLVATVQRPTQVSDGQGGWVTEYPDDHDETVVLGAPNGHDVPVAHKKEGVIHFPCWADPGVDIRIGDRLIIADATYEVRVTKLGIPGKYTKLLLELYEEDEE